MPGRVLIVDDDEGFLMTTKQLVELDGHQALVASTLRGGPAAAAQCRAGFRSSPTSASGPSTGFSSSPRPR